jgi:hypothetical protein
MFDIIAHKEGAKLTQKRLMAKPMGTTAYREMLKKTRPVKGTGVGFS